MSFSDENPNIIDQLYEEANPIIKHKIQSEFLNKKNSYTNCTINSNDDINYWKDIFSGNEIHGSRDSTFENSIAKLLEFGFDKSYNFFHDQFKVYLKDEFWNDDQSFNAQLLKTVVYPFMIRAGYHDNPNVRNYFIERIEAIERTINKYGYNIFTQASDTDKIVFKIDIENEWIPTIYDLYAFSYDHTNDDDLRHRISNIVNYILDDRFQSIPQKAYIFDKTNKRYYATGNVYHACFCKGRELLMVHLLSTIENTENNPRFKKELSKLLKYKTGDGFYEIDRTFVNEKSNVNFLYSGAHMGLGENRRSKKWCRIESTYWMLKILKNISSNRQIKS